MREKDSAASTTWVHAGDDVLEESIVGAPLWRDTIDVAPVRIGLSGRTVPLLDRIGGIGKYHVEAAQVVAFDKLWFGESIAALNVEVLDTMQEKIHARDSRGDEIALLSIELESAIFFALSLKFRNRREQHAAGTAGGIIN